MAATDLPSPSELHKYLSYDPETGIFTWLARTPEMFEDGGDSREHNCKKWNGKHAGRPTLFTDNGEGYLGGRINSRHLSAHRAAYALMTGEWPSAEIDHINGNRRDNRWANLRAVSAADNCKNKARMASNTSGFNGVSWHVRSGKWQAHVTLNERQRYLGLFASKEDAIAARERANLTYGFTTRHGLAV